MIAKASTIVWGALGERFKADTFKRPMVWGPHAVGGAKAGPKRLSK
jgi:hypothetical protein